jgi:PIN domain nuclease of toxin-antitoxin system
MSVVVDASAILAFFHGKAPNLLEHFSKGEVVVNEVTAKTVEWALIQAGGKRLEVQNDLTTLGLEVVEFGEKLAEAIKSLPVATDVNPPTLEESSSAALALARKLPLVSGRQDWSGVAGLNTTLVGINIQPTQSIVKDLL